MALAATTSSPAGAQSSCREVPPRDRPLPPPLQSTACERAHDVRPSQAPDQQDAVPPAMPQQWWDSSSPGWLPAHGTEKSHSVGHSLASRDSAQRRAERSVKKDIGALFILMTVMPFVSIAIAVYALAAFLLVTLTTPFFLCAKHSTLDCRYLSLLRPGLNTHYKMAYSSRRCEIGAAVRSWPGYVSHPHSPTSSNFSDLDVQLQSNPSAAQLFTVLLASPVLALPVAFANFIIMCFWFMSALTDIGGSDGGMDDGRVLAKRVRRFWVRWLSGELLSQRSPGDRQRGRSSDS